MPATRTVVYGGTFSPPHNGHVACVETLKGMGFEVVVVPSAGHEFKPESRATYAARKVLAAAAFGADMLPVEDHIDLDDARRALLIMRQVRALRGGEVVFAHGPDIDPATWTGYAECIAEGFKFMALPENGNGTVRATVVREMMARGECVAHLVPAAVAALL